MDLSSQSKHEARVFLKNDSNTLNIKPENDPQ